MLKKALFSFILLASSLVFTGIVSVDTAMAQTPAGNQGANTTSSSTPNSCTPESSILGFPTWYKYLPGETNQGKCRPVLDDSASALPIGLAIFEITLTLAGLVAVVMIFVGSFKYIITLGEPDKATGARKTVINALIGMAITLIAARVVSFLAFRITGGS